MKPKLKPSEEPVWLFLALVNEKCYMWTLNDILEDQIMY